jgi:PRTRC genetic system ThiF family protein
MKAQTPVHYTDHYLLNPEHPVTVTLIGAGGTGSQMLTCLARMHQAMLALDYPGLMVIVYDDDTVSPANLGRQLFAEAEIGMNKGAALIGRINRFFGTAWKAVPRKFDVEIIQDMSKEGQTNLYISCVDTAKARFSIAEILESYIGVRTYERSRPLYWMDLGNSRDTGQVLISTIGQLKQPDSKKYKTVSRLPFLTDMFRTLLAVADESDDTPSCSLAEALTKQDLFVNSTLANMGASLLWQLFREGVLFNRGFFMNLQDFRTQPIRITAEERKEQAA